MASVPTRPDKFVISSYTDVRVNGDANANGNGGSPVLEWEVAWSTNASHVQSSGNLNSSGSGFITGLTPGQTYYFWNRQRNAVGWSEYSARTDIVMRSAPDPPTAPAVAGFTRTQTSANVTVFPNGDGGAPITQYQLFYGLDTSSATDSIFQTSSGFHLIDLIPGETYYLWGKVVNQYGTSLVSARTTLVLVAGAYVKVGFTWKRAVPYVRDGGVWKMARTWGRVSGVWKQSSD